jgi:hypothetical protein
LKTFPVFSGLGTCSCTDCELSCAPPDFSPFKKTEFGIIKGLDYWALVISLVFGCGIFSCILIFGLSDFICPKHHNNQVQDIRQTAKDGEIETGANVAAAVQPVKDGLGSKMDQLMIKMFTIVAKFSAKNPILVLIGMTGIAFVLCCGINKLRYRFSILSSIFNMSNLRFRNFLYSISTFDFRFSKFLFSIFDFRFLNQILAQRFSYYIFNFQFLNFFDIQFQFQF